MNIKFFFPLLLLISNYSAAMNPKKNMAPEINEEVEESIRQLILSPSQHKKRRIRKAKSGILSLKKTGQSNLRRTISMPITKAKKETLKLRLLIRAIKDQNQAGVKKYACKEIINRADREERTPLIWAALFGNGTIVHLLLKENADPNRTNINGNTPLHIALLKKDINPGIVQLLIDAGTRLYFKNNKKQSVTELLKKARKENPALKDIKPEQEI